ncbi:MAG: transcription-repair coupling factor [Pirellulales bacterium]
MTADSHTAAPPEDRLRELAGRLEQHAGFSDVVAGLMAGRDGSFEGVWGSSRALLAAALKRHAPQTLLIVCPQESDVDLVCDDLRLFTATPPERFPAWEAEPDERLLDDEIYGDRLAMLKKLARGRAAHERFPELVVTSIRSLLQPVPDRPSLLDGTRRLAVGETLELTALADWLTQGGFHHTSAVELPGEYSLRGGILDIFAADWDAPIRVELFGDEITSLRSFEVATQRSLESFQEAEVTILHRGQSEQEHFAAYLPEGAWLLLLDMPQIDEQGRLFLQRVDSPQQYHSVAAVFERLSRFASAAADSVGSGADLSRCRLQIESVERFSGDMAKVRGELESVAGQEEVLVVCPTEAEVERLREIFRDTALASESRLHFPIGTLHAGFRLVRDGIVLVSSGELFQRTDLVRSSRRRLGRAIDSFLSLREGDLVVHLAHGIGRYRGLKLLEKENQGEEHLELEFHGGTKIYVPAAKIDLVQKYVGGSRGKTALARIGSASWARQKKAAERAVNDMAVDMLDLQAARAARPGIRFPEDTVWQREFDASFPYQETPDQLSAMKAIKQDMQTARPMDRLLCGDVGYGKTELAVRAAFKAVDAGYQVAVLVPTTILAEQHLRTFTSRMAEFPFEIAVLSRFCTKGQQRKIVEGLAQGAIDIVVGTHRLAQADVRFQNLGLVIIDEEQRFGVEVKERLKSLRQMVDVLTMTATPIPRTLHLSLLGVRNISSLETPPEDRLSVETRVSRFDEDLTRHAIMRELNRGGQIYFVHNRVNDIELVAARLARIVPEARIEIGHGQMAESQLEEVMLRFVDHQFDVLLCTTIIESGLDIPNANTIFLDDADRYGLADLHQLRGRVGRYKHRAYCYLLIDENKHLSPEAARRLRAIEEFREMGAGFAIAMRDLELRGAGNILGTEQSGHLANVGYELYCSLLEKTVRRLQQLPPKESVEVHVDLPGEAYLPDDYVGDMRLKIDLYRRLARLTKLEELRDFTSELRDRFGPPPRVVERLISLAELRILAHHWQIGSIHLESKYAVFGHGEGAPIAQLSQRSGRTLRRVDARTTYLPLGKEFSHTDGLLDQLKSLLRTA